jgi:hypothetical protein
MTHSYWLAQTVAVSAWLDSRGEAGATSLDRSPGFFTRSSAEHSRNGSARIANVLVILTKFTAV